MKRPNLQEILQNQKRCEQIEHLLPVAIDGLSKMTSAHCCYAQAHTRIHELLLEYRERKGEDFYLHGKKYVLAGESHA